VNAPDSIDTLLARSLQGQMPQLESAFTSNSHPIVITDARRRIVWVNRAFVELTGYTLAEAIGRSPGVLLQCPETDPVAVARLRELLRAGKPATTRLLNRSRSGRLYWVELDIHPFGPPGQPPLGFIAVQPDISARTNAADRLRAVLDVSAAGVVVQDEDGRINDCNPAAEQMLGLRRDQLLGLTSVDPRWRAIRADGSSLPGDDHPAMHTLRTGEAMRDVLMGVELPGGERRWLMVNTTPLPRDDGPTWVVCSFTDVTAQHELERQLQAQWERLRTTLEGTQTATWEWEVQTGVLTVDARWAEMLGWRADEAGRLDMRAYIELTQPDDLVAARPACVIATAAGAGCAAAAGWPGAAPMAAR
jgi:PAS domain S-box-containing protein